MKRFFGTDGIRGTVGKGFINPIFMLRLGHAVGCVLKKWTGERRPSVVIGKDTRISGYMIESALEAGFISAGVDVFMVGPLPTPGIAYMTKARRLDLGVVISASHNPFEDNGVKFFSADGKKLPEIWEKEVEEQLEQPFSWATSDGLGRATRIDDAQGRYVEFCKSTFDPNRSLKGLKIVVDGAHGAAYYTAPEVFHELGADVIRIGCSPDGLNINAGFGATSPQALIDAVIAHGADFGVALDGDADRLQMVDHRGRLYNGDELLYVLAQNRQASETVHGVVGTLMTNKGIEDALAKLKITLVRAKVGDKYVLEEMEKHQFTLGGESSGHILVLDKHSTGDGTIAALQVLEAVVASSWTLEELLENVELYPQVMISVKVADTSDWKMNTYLHAQIEISEMLLREAGGGRVLIRESGTEPVVRVMVEGKDASLAKDRAQLLSELIKNS